MKPFFATLFAMLVAGPILVIMLSAMIFVTPRYGVFYDTRHTEAMQYRVTGDRVEIMIHGEWVDHLFYEVKHLGFHIEQQLKRELKGAQ